MHIIVDCECHIDTPYEDMRPICLQCHNIILDLLAGSDSGGSVDAGVPPTMDLLDIIFILEALTLDLSHTVRGHEEFHHRIPSEGR